MKFKNIFWGLSLIIIGSLLVARNLGMAHFDWFNIIRLWPLIFILWGLSVLPIRETIKIGVLVILLGGATWFVLKAPESDLNWNWNTFSKWDQSDNYWGQNDNSFENGEKAGKKAAEFLKDVHTFSAPYTDSIQYASLEMDAAAGSFFLADTSSDLINFSQAGTYRSLYEYYIKQENHNVRIRISEKHERNFYSRNHKNVTIRLNPKPIWNISLNAGASAVNYDLSKFKVRKISLDGGAGSFKITLGDKYPNVKVGIDAGASSLTLRVPENTGCDLEITAVLSGKHMPGFVKISSGHYQTENYDTAKNKIHLNVDAAVSSFRIIRY